MGMQKRVFPTLFPLLSRRQVQKFVDDIPYQKVNIDNFVTKH